MTVQGQIRRLRGTGMSTRKVAKEVGVSVGTVVNYSAGLDTGEPA